MDDIIADLFYISEYALSCRKQLKKQEEPCQVHLDRMLELTERVHRFFDKQLASMESEVICNHSSIIDARCQACGNVFGEIVRLLEAYDASLELVYYDCECTKGCKRCEVTQQRAEIAKVLEIIPTQSKLYIKGYNL